MMKVIRLCFVILFAGALIAPLPGWAASTKTKEKSAATTPAKKPSEKKALIDINTASVEELMSLKG